MWARLSCDKNVIEMIFDKSRAFVVRRFLIRGDRLPTATVALQDMCSGNEGGIVQGGAGRERK